MTQRCNHGRTPNVLSPLLRLWILRMLVPFEAHRAFVHDGGFWSDAVASLLGLGEWLEPASGVFDAQGARKALRECHQAAEQQSARAACPDRLAANVSRLQTLVGLSDTDCRILEFAVSIYSEPVLVNAAQCLGAVSSSRVPDVLSVLLDIPEREIRAALSSQAILARSGIVSVQHDGEALLHAKLDLLSTHFAHAVSSSDADPVTFLRGIISPAPAGHLELSDFAHLDRSLAILRPYLKHAVGSGRAGVNIFVYGAPGTGKSELARALARDAGCELFEVASDNEDGNAVLGERRLRAFRAAQCLFSKSRTVLLFDEAEDVFDDNTLGYKSTAQTRKGFVNRMLEDNAVPALWLSNSIEGLDPAFVRRFDMVFELPVPPRGTRERILRKACPEFLSQSQLTRLAAAPKLTPAVVTRAASVVRSIQDELGAAGPAAAMEWLIDATLQAQGHPRVGRADPQGLADLYDPQFISADVDLADIATGLLHARSGRLCLFGPPGTGKTAFGHWLAVRLDVPLLVKKASDLISMWVGGTERNIAKAFHEAEEQHAVLLIDEVDSFLQDRGGARRSWEVTGVNEMLTQMEAFPGVFIASTNRMEGLDPAALRRFDLKVKFGFLQPSQARELLSRYCHALEIAPPAPANLARVSALRVLTPGDFAAVARQSRFRPIASATALIEALASECALKEPPHRPIGFHA